MADVNGAAATASENRTHGSLLRSPKVLIAVLVALAAIAGGGGYWYLLPSHSAAPVKEQAAEPPFYLELKPFVVSIANDSGTPHFVQFGLNLALSDKAAGDALSAILPEVQDELRQTALSFKVEDIVTPSGVDRLRQAMIASANHLLLRRLGAAGVARLNRGDKNGAIVRGLYFTTLIVE
jgi:flagellar basal body-associated protein FliL